jgi:hypothetical protein
MLRRVALVRTVVSEEPGASFIRVTRIGELGTTQAATSNRRKLRRNTKYFFAACVPPKRRFLQEPHGVISQKTPFFNICTSDKIVQQAKRSKAIPETDRADPEDCETSRISHFLSNGLTSVGKVVSLRHRQGFNLGKIPGTHFCWGRVNP